MEKEGCDGYNLDYVYTYNNILGTSPVAVLPIFLQECECTHFLLYFEH